MKQILFFISILVLSFQLLSQDCNAQNVVLTISGNDSNVFETVSTDSYRSQLEQNFQGSSALTYFIMQEIEKDSDIFSITRQNDGVSKVFSIVAKSNLTANQVDAKIVAGINNANVILQDYMQQNNFSASELADFVKSNLLD